MPFTVQKTGNTFKVIDERAVQFYNELPPDVYTVKFNPAVGYYLEAVDKFVRPLKIYGDIQKNCDLILKTYFDREKSTGVLLSGLKGAGKSQLARLISIEMLEKHGLPTILVCSPFHGEDFNKLIQSIDQRCVVLFDEFEKTYDSEEQERMLSLLDGVFQSQKLFVLTVNNKYRLDDNMRNRPGRLYYSFDYSSLSEDFIRELGEDRLDDKAKLEELIQVSSMISDMNFDMAVALIEETNRYPEEKMTSLLKRLNIKPEYQKEIAYSATVTEIKTGKKIPLERETLMVSPFNDFDDTTLYGAYTKGKGAAKSEKYHGYQFEIGTFNLKEIKGGNKLLVFEILDDKETPEFRVVLMKENKTYDYSRVLAF